MKLLITGGGTGGHVNPGLAIAGYWKEKQPQTEIAFAGTDRGIETRLVPWAGYPLYTIPVRGLSRSLTPKALGHNANALRLAAQSVGRAKKILREFKPDCVIGTGGYASFPTVYAAQKMGIPTAILEVNAYPGLASRVLSKRAGAVMICYENARKLLSGGPEPVLTGAPVRPDLVHQDRAQARAQLGIGPGEKLVVSFWGSLGAEYMNRHMVDFIVRECRHEPFVHLHAMGAFAKDWMPQRIAQAGVDLKQHPRVRLVEYIYNMAQAMAAADLLICRAGAATMGEICLLGKPSILVPSPYVAENHQEKNARALEEKGGCLVLTEKSCTGEVLLDKAQRLLADEGRCLIMSQNARKNAITDSQERIYQQILALL